VMDDSNVKPGLVDEGLQLAFPQANTKAIAAPTIGGDEQAGCVRIPALTQGEPPASNAFDREGRGIVIGAEIDQAGVGRNVIDAIGSDLAECGNLEVMNAYGLRIAFGPQLTTTILEIADQFLLFGIDRDGRLVAITELFDLRIDCSNCMSRSGWVAPSRVFLLA